MTSIQSNLKMIVISTTGGNCSVLDNRLLIWTGTDQERYLTNKIIDSNQKLVNKIAGVTSGRGPTPEVILMTLLISL